MWTAAKLKELRERFAETQAQFAERLGVSVYTVRCWEQEQGDIPLIAQKFLARLEKDLAGGGSPRPPRQRRQPLSQPLPVPAGLRSGAKRCRHL